MSQRQLNKIRAQAKIVAAAAALIETGGVADTTTRAIAQAAGVSYQTLYNYFPTKALIIQELLKEDITAWNQSVDNILKSYDRDLIGSLLAICDQAANMPLGQKKDLWKAIAQQSEVLASDNSAFSAIAHEHCYALLHSALGNGHLRSDTDLHLMAHTLFSLCDYNLLGLHLAPIPKEQYLQTQRQQFELVIGPYLI